MGKKLLFVLVSYSLILCVPHVDASTTLNYEYDANGNLIRGDGKYYEYNDANQLVKVRHGDASGHILAEYFYDYTGQRIKKVENGTTTYYIGKHYEKQVSSASSTNTSYYFANNERVAKKDSLGNMYYYHSDHLGGTNVLTDSSGNLVERIKYYPFGEIREGGSEKYSFTGKEKDKLTDFYYFEARYYNPEFKHFTQADSIAPNIYDPQDLNRYTYVRNNSLKLIDPTGNAWWNPKDWYKWGKETWNKTKELLTYDVSEPLEKPAEKVVETSYNIYSNMNKSDKATLQSAAENIPNPVGSSIETTRWFVNSTNYINQGEMYRYTNGSLGSPYTLSKSYETFLESAPLGVGFPFKAGRFFVGEMAGMATGGKKGEIHSTSETYEVLESVPFGVGFMFTAGKYISQDVLGELLYQQGWYFK